MEAHGGAVPTVDDVISICEGMESRPADAEQLSKLLYDIQRTEWAWEIADQLLQRKASNYSCIFAAQTLVQKIQSNFHELPAESLDSLRSAILAHLVAFSSNPGVAIHLAVALADLAVYMEGWPSPVSDVMEQLSAHGEELVLPLLQFLRVYPEEIWKDRIRISERRCRALSQSLGDYIPQVFPFLENILEAAGDNVEWIKNVFRCLSSWLEETGHSEVISPELVNSPLLITAVQHLTQEALCDSAADVICEVIYLCKKDSKDVANIGPFYAAVISPLTEALLELTDGVKQCIAEEEEDAGLGHALCRVFTDLCICEAQHLDRLSSPQVMSLVEIVLEFTAHKSQAVRTQTFFLWTAIGDCIYDLTTEAEKVQAQEFFRPHFVQLFHNIAVMSACEDDQEGLLHSDSEVADFRARVRTLMGDTAFIVGSGRLTSMLLGMCGEASSWQAIEAPLSVMLAVAKHWGITKKTGTDIPAEDSAVVQAVIEQLLSLPEDIHEQLRAGVTQYLGRMSRWISYNGAALQPIMQFLLQSVEKRAVIVATTVTLKQIAFECADIMAPHFEVLVQVMQAAPELNLYESESKCGDDFLDVVAAVARVLGRFDAAGITAAMETVCMPEIEKVHMAFSQVPVVIPDIALETLSHIFRNVNVTSARFHEDGSHPCWPIVEKMWPVLKAGIEALQTSRAGLEQCFKCVKWILRCLGTCSIPIVPELLQEISRIFQMHFQSTCLYLASVLTVTFGKDEGSIPGILEMVESLTEQTFALFTSDENAIGNNPDVVEDFFRMITKLLDVQPIVFLSSSFAPAALECATACATLDQRDAHETVMEFLRRLVNVGRRSETDELVQAQGDMVAAVLQLMERHGEALISQLAVGITGGLRPFLLPDVSEVLYDMGRLQIPVGEWLSASPAIANLDDSKIAPHEKEEFFQAFVRDDRQTRQTVTSAVRRFSKLFS